MLVRVLQRPNKYQMLENSFWKLFILFAVLIPLPFYAIPICSVVLLPHLPIATAAAHIAAQNLHLHRKRCIWFCMNFTHSWCATEKVI